MTRGDSLLQDDTPCRYDEVLREVVSILRDGHPVDLSRAWWHSAGCWILRRSQLSTRMLIELRKRLRPN